MSTVELDQLLSDITGRIAEEKWKATARQLEIEASDAVNALREFTKRNYMLMLGTVVVAPAPKRMPRCRLRIAA